MGMGKTIEVLALLLARRDLAAGALQDARFPPPPKPSSRPALPRHRGTLVVAPMSVVGQWADEVTRFSAPGVSRVLCHYGGDRVSSVAALRGFDVVVTSFGTLVSEASALGIRPAKTANASESELPYVASGDGRRGATPVLFGVHWDRVVLDEAHAIKNRATEVRRCRRGGGACVLAVLTQQLACDPCDAVPGASPGCSSHVLHSSKPPVVPHRDPHPKFAPGASPLALCRASWYHAARLTRPLAPLLALQDLYSLFRFLRHQPWCEIGWWKRVISTPYEKGDASALPRLKVRAHGSVLPAARVTSWSCDHVLTSHCGLRSHSWHFAVGAPARCASPHQAHAGC